MARRFHGGDGAGRGVSLRRGHDAAARVADRRAHGAGGVGASGDRPRLRAAIAAHLRAFAAEVHPDQIVIGSGAQSLYGLLVQLLGRNLAYGVEDPGYPRLTRIYESNDVAVRPIASRWGRAGLGGARACPGIDVSCTAVAQFPTGITVPVSRRRRCWEWARVGLPAPGRFWQRLGEIRGQA